MNLSFTVEDPNFTSHPALPLTRGSDIPVRIDK